MHNYFDATRFHTLFQPSYCQRRVWLEAQESEVAAGPSAFQQLLTKRSLDCQKRYLNSIGNYIQPAYPEGDAEEGFLATLDLLSRQVPIIYRPVLLDKTLKILSIPDFLILDRNKEYVLRDARLGFGLANRAETAVTQGMAHLLVNIITGKAPRAEVVLKSGSVVEFEPNTKNQVMKMVQLFRSLSQTEVEPQQELSKTRCEECCYQAYCWEKATRNQELSLIPYLDKEACVVLKSQGYKDYADLAVISMTELAEVKWKRKNNTYRIGREKAEKIKSQVKALYSNQCIVSNGPLQSPVLGQRPVMVLDVESYNLDSGGVGRVYLWGSLLALPNHTLEKSIVTGKARGGNKAGWGNFLQHVESAFETYGDFPIIHFGSAEQTFINTYLQEYGDRRGVGQRLLANMWDIQNFVANNTFLPVYSYGLKEIEKVAGFKRSQLEYGGRWSLAKYHQYLKEDSQEKAQTIMAEIVTYNKEDLRATLQIFLWLENLAG